MSQEAPKDDFLPHALAVGVSEIHLQYNLCTPTIIQQIHEAGLGRMALIRGRAGMAEDIETKYWDDGPDKSSPLIYAALLQSGVQQLCVNKPEVLIAMFAPRSMKKRLFSIFHQKKMLMVFIPRMSGVFLRAQKKVLNPALLGVALSYCSVMA